MICEFQCSKFEVGGRQGLLSETALHPLLAEMVEECLVRPIEA